MRDYCKLYKTMLDNPNYFNPKYVETINNLCSLQKNKELNNPSIKFSIQKMKSN